MTVRLEAESPSTDAPAARFAGHAPRTPPFGCDAGASRGDDPGVNQIALIDGLRLRRDAFKQVLQQCMPENEVLCYNSGEELRAASSQGALRAQLIVINAGGEPLWDRAMRSEISAICRELALVPVVILSDRAGADDVAEACRLGVRGFLPTSLEPQVVREALNYARVGGIYFPPGSLIQVLISVLNGRERGAQGGGASNFAAADGHDLTPRQRQVLALLCLGKPNKVIAYELGIDERTVKVHVRHIMREFRVSNRTEVLLRAQHLNLIARAADGSG